MPSGDSLTMDPSNMARKQKPRLSDLTVKAADCFDPADYYMVHKAYFDGMRTALREAHRKINDEWGGDTSSCVCIYCSPPSANAPP
jgi:hypothetical protein